MIRSTRGRCAGSDPRLARRFLARSARFAGSAASSPARPSASICSASSRPQQQLIDQQALGPAPEAMALQLLDDLA